MRNKISIVALALILLCGIQVALGFSDVPNKAEGIQPLLPGMMSPAVTFTAVDGSKFELLKETAVKPVILIFYRGGW